MADNVSHNITAAVTSHAVIMDTLPGDVIDLTDPGEVNALLSLALYRWDKGTGRGLRRCRIGQASITGSDPHSDVTNSEGVLVRMVAVPQLTADQTARLALLPFTVRGVWARYVLSLADRLSPNNNHSAAVTVRRWAGAIRGYIQDVTA